ncbi:hypothetical protein E2C01_094023 [Portunus trituberculatus]|uniref:Uncharacterized protein n=1 Tax=Portunus trituberculatus TaxID=210409 RepID=A0A5B7JVU4_PORTR|nr:hypothetical protein [Portunus trituberculatus]
MPPVSRVALQGVKPTLLHSESLTRERYGTGNRLSLVNCHTGEADGESDIVSTSLRLEVTDDLWWHGELWEEEEEEEEEEERGDGK